MNFLKVLLKFADVRICTDYTKKEIEDVLSNLQKKAEAFENQKKRKERLAICIINIGHFIAPAWSDAS